MNDKKRFDDTGHERFVANLKRPSSAVTAETPV